VDSAGPRRREQHAWRRGDAVEERECGGDPIVPPVNARLLARRIPSARLELIHGAGHVVLMDVAERCATTIADFLDEQTTAA
jgi:pimeloyl-ACP methyl ester carboxylesterase